MSKNNYTTRKGFDRYRDELNQLVKIERPEMTKTVAWAASLGDRSENADYKYGKKRLREIDKRIRFLTARIEDAVVVEPREIESDKIQFGATVTTEDEDGNTKKYSIVGVDETNPSQGLISWRSPIGKSLLGKEEGDLVIIRTPNGEKELEIIEIEYIDI
ncbi:transcription elongation factor GreB [Bacteriovorax sp. DB6_IX]|uniref:transcription elongation factor GreB n=1 Tax=Bacteriovorax sp. DB6_IX TaxID=1353530 RepID=UPI00038A2FDF|nr:transcription elongation factor GreB [Bacteriovorax sp. DB6_IX]EQC48981.1 transcription elongation factor GreB [Bacteriovorax sp. DB6_IX]